MIKLLGLALLGATVMAAGPALAADAEAGAKTFRKCKACHVVEKEQNRVGPHLVGIVGRTAGSVDGFRYSDSLKAKHDEGFVWTTETIELYLADPKGYIPGNKMAFAGLKKEEDRANVIAYLESVSPGS